LRGQKQGNEEATQTQGAGFRPGGRSGMVVQKPQPPWQTASGCREERRSANVLERIAASKETPAPVVALRIPEADLALARKQAEQKGLSYQTYIKSPLHKTLAEREKRKVGW